MASVKIDGFDASTTSELESVVEHLEGGHGDTIVFIASHVYGAPLADARIASISPRAIGLDVREPQGPATAAELRFPEETTTTMGVRGHLIGTLGAARQAQPEHPITSIEEELQTTQSLVTWVGEVRATRTVAKNLLEVTIGGLDGMPEVGGDEFSYVLIPRPGDDEPLPAGVPFSALQELPEHRQPHGAYYTTRRRRPEHGELDLWVYLHGVDGLEGAEDVDDPEAAGAPMGEEASAGSPTVAQWAATAAPGDQLALWGPRRGYHPPENTQRHVLVCDETGLAAAAALIDQYQSAEVVLVAKVAGPNRRPPMPEHPALTEHWYGPDDQGHDLVAAVRSLGLVPGATSAFGAAESREISAVRRLLRNELGFAATDVHMTGYWRA
ncbi:MAG: siderophore-interacting protein [Actinomycetota bacterium]